MTAADRGPVPRSPVTDAEAVRPEGLPPVPIGRRGRLARAVADAVGSVGGVALTDRGGVSTQYAGGAVTGVGLAEESVTVQVVGRALPLPPLLDAVHRAATAALAQAGDPRPLRVHLVDLELPGGLGVNEP